ncbi:hypothetical protein B0A49_12017 [Cryomyces minteri]|uniref:Uncharacterized protein n=1 Tax=Cryomyces minteri TaxID=331657 RepID=A0A4U0VU22_9PEZI|nr:hypothetical protein B0A49_12017 [Cryomyces minteri]
MMAIASQVPSTPLRSPRRAAFLQDSPFSDYFTEPSITDEPSASTDAQKALLKQLTNIGAHILRSEPGADLTPTLHSRLQHVQAALDDSESMFAQSRRPADIGDSALFMDDDEHEEEQRENVDAGASPGLAKNLQTAREASTETEKRNRADHERLLKEAREVLARVTKSTTQLRLRYEETKLTNNAQTLKIKESTKEIVRLGSENEVLRSHLSSDRSELLFLKLQLKALEARTSPYLDGKEDSALIEEIEHWELDWKDVDARLRRRREKYTSLDAVEEPDAKTDGRDWHLSMVRRRNGNVESITIERLFGAEADPSTLDEDRLQFSTGSDEAAVETSYVDSQSHKSGSATSSGFIEAHCAVGEEVAKMEAANGPLINESEQSDEEEAETTSTHQAKTPWQELWDSLTVLAGMSVD